jgi:ATP-dependent DNA helicase DinG
MAAVETTTRALPTLHEFFAPGGILARSSLPYEYRPGQLEMAKAVERALAERRHLIVEAGTGTGKTLAYLLPALRTGQRVIVSTGTKALQDQLFFRDVPFLETLLGPLRVCYMKGRANYLCRHKLVTLQNQPILSGLEEIDQYRQIAEWEQTTETGDRAELSGMPESSALWNKLDARSEACLGTTCPDYRDAAARARVGHHYRQPPPVLRGPFGEAGGRGRAGCGDSSRGGGSGLRRSA